MKKILVILMMVAMVVLFTACSNNTKVETPTLSNPNETIITETIITEDIITEKTWENNVQTYDNFYNEELEYNSKTNNW